jgi:hypothetical protein
MSVDKILHEASTVLQTALRYSSQLSEVQTIDHDIHRMRVLITIVAAHSYSKIGDNANLVSEVNELQSVKETILKTAERRFGSANKVLEEFHYTPKQAQNF